MWYLRPSALGVLILLPSITLGVVMTHVDDPQNERAICYMHNDPKVKALRMEFDALARRMHFWKKRDFEALFGPPAHKINADYALTCTQPRMVWTSGISLAGQASREHTAEYAVGDGLRVYVHFYGESPNRMYFYLRVKDGFVRLDRTEQLEARVTWERGVLWKALKHVQERWRAVVEWEVDEYEFDKLFVGREAVDPDAKFRAYSEWGEKQKLRLAHDRGSWQWYRGEARVASVSANGDESPTNFFLFGAGEREVRAHTGGTNYYSIRWNRGDDSSARYETWVRDEARGPWRAVEWVWSGPGERGKRSEEDTNGDGIPDEVKVTAEGKEPQRAPLKVEHSWAIHPKLIPIDWRVADEPERRLPVRRITK